MKQYTPGPWRWIGEGILFSDSEQIEVLNSAINLFDGDLDADLIAAAPEMLEALELFEAIQVELSNLPFIKHKHFWKMQNALKKARGENE